MTKRQKANPTSRATADARLGGPPHSFAVQLLWSQRPIDPASVPQVDIFGEYRLYTTECRYRGRKWYALRLGFFSNAVFAKQVANYLRSQFASVAVLPISEAERIDATAEPASRTVIARAGVSGRTGAQSDDPDDKVRVLRIDVHQTRAFRQLLALLKQRARGS